jgi:serine protease Do
MSSEAVSNKTLWRCIVSLRNKKAISVFSILLILVLLTACSSSSDTNQTEVPEADTGESVSEDSLSELESGAVSSLEDVQNAVVRIEAQGTFIDPTFGLQVNSAGGGSGFIIHPSGIAITNNHVVTGAALLRVYVNGESEPRNAQILGVSECSDLAVIDIDGDGYSYLSWHDDEVNVGLEVYAAGYPFGDPEFTLTKGIVSKARADGESNWASVNYVLEHDATINFGNSGGPLVDSNGHVVGVNYAHSLVGLNQFYAIKADEAKPVIESMRQGDDVDSIGINGVAVVSDDGTLSGIWVSSVKSGSPADITGVEPGDLIITLEGLVLSTDGTMADYCDILRTHGDDSALSIEVMRYATGEYLEGQINGPPLTFVSSLGGQTTGGTSSGGSSGGGATGGSYSSYVTISDNTSSLQMQVPVEWNQVDGTQWFDDYGEIIGPSLTVSSNISNYIDTWSEPGVFFFATAVEAGFGVYDYLDIVANNLQGSCDYVNSEVYSDGYYEGQVDYYTACGGIADYVVFGVVPSDYPQSYMLGITIQVVTDADWEAVDRIFASFAVIGQIAPADISGGEPYMTITDDYYSIQVTVPSDWVDIDGSPWFDSGDVIGASIQASSDLTAFDNWLVPGVIFNASDDLADLGGYIQVLDIYRQGYLESCDFVERESYEDNLYRGKYDLYEKCGGSGGPDFLVLSAVPKDDQFAFIIVVRITITSEEDWDALVQILDSFTVIDTLP